MTDAADLRDLRAKITAESDQVLEAVSRATGRDKSELVREVLHEWADRKLHEARLIHRLARSEGSDGSRGEKAGT